MRIGITGSDGLMGWHLRCYLKANLSVEMVPGTRATFATDESLAAFVKQCNVIVHLAGMNRGPDAELERINIGLSERLIIVMERLEARPHVIFSSSTHIARDTPYGRSKRVAAGKLADWSARRGARFTNLVLPHVFGEGGRPFYNSVVSTFCHQIARDEQPAIDRDGELELLHAQDVARIVADSAQAPGPAELQPTGTRLRVSDLLPRLQGLASQYRSGLIPHLSDTLDLRLFNTLRSYLFPSHYPVRLDVKNDPRGSLVELVRTLHGGQSFMSWTRPGVARGNHFHTRKLERFLVLAGSAVIRVRRLFDDRVHEFRVEGSAPQYVDMPTLHTHSITNVGEGDLLTLFWSHDLFDKNEPDTYSEAV